MYTLTYPNSFIKNKPEFTLIERLELIYAFQLQDDDKCFHKKRVERNKQYDYI